MTKIAVVQFKASTNKKQNLEKITDYINKAAKKGAKLIAFPEFMMFYTTSSQTPSQLSNQAETIKGDFVNSIRKAAKENSIQVVGTLYEKSNKKNRVYDTSFPIKLEKGSWVVQIIIMVAELHHHFYKKLGYVLPKNPVRVVVGL